MATQARLRANNNYVKHNVKKYQYRFIQKTKKCMHGWRNTKAWLVIFASLL